jgi:hypothetical protein
MAMMSPDFLAREAAVGGLLLIASGLSAWTLRGNLIGAIFGAWLLLLGGVLLAARRHSVTVDAQTASMLLAGTIFVPVASAAFALWRSTSGWADQASLRTPVGDDGGD